MRRSLVFALVCMVVVAGCGGGDDDTPAPQPRTPEAVAERVNSLIAAFLAMNYVEVCAQLAPKASEGLIRAAAEEGTETNECSDAAAALYSDLPDVGSSEVPEVRASDVTLDESDSAVVDAPGPGGNSMTLVYEDGSWLALSPLFTR